MDLDGSGVDVSLGVKVDVKAISRQATIDEFHAADFDDAMSFRRVEPRGFGIKYDLSHESCSVLARILRVHLSRG